MSNIVGVAAVGKDSGSDDEPPSSKNDSEPHPDSSVRFGHELRRRRESQDMTLEEFSERCGRTTNYIGTVENGKRDPSLSTILAFAEGLGVPAGELLGAIPDLSAAAFEMAQLFDRTSPGVQGAILMILRITQKRRRK